MKKYHEMSDSEPEFVSFEIEKQNQEISRDQDWLRDVSKDAS